MASGPTPIPPTPTPWMRRIVRPNSGGKVAGLIAQPSRSCSCRVNLRGGRLRAPRLRRRGFHRLREIVEHERKRIGAVHALEVAAKFPQQPVVENNIEH